MNSNIYSAENFNGFQETKWAKTNLVYINPNFSQRVGQKIHVNPRVALFCDSTNQPYRTQSLPNRNIIHINPNIKNMQIPQTVHVNPNFKNAIPNPIMHQSLKLQKTQNTNKVSLNKPVLLTKMKLIRTPAVEAPKTRKRRISVKSKFKIVRSTPLTSPKSKNTVSRFKVDRRSGKQVSDQITKKKYVSNNRIIKMTSWIKNTVIKKKPNKQNLSIVNISGVMYGKSRTTLRKTNCISNVYLKKSLSNITKSKYKLIKKAEVKKQLGLLEPKNKNKYKVYNTPTILKTKTKISQKKMKKCNIPCIYYRKYGICKKAKNGKCSRKHDPDQIALCTRFLQGACVKDKCLLSHNVSPEKMPICKFYLEGSCVKENCPYLHVKLSRNTEVCRDFLEGFCRNAAQCNKRHQYLCPEYEKYGSCSKQRCAYPHGNMVRSYLICKNKFAKNYSTKNSIKMSKQEIQKKENKPDERQRYYIKEDAHLINGNKDERESEEFVGSESRPKLGSLPAFIPFNE